MANFKIQLPFFPGFYESELFNSDTLYNEFCPENMEHYREYFEDEELEADDLDLDFGSYQKACCEAYTSAFHDLCPDFVNGLSFSELWSPKFYNTTTDRAYAEIELADDWKEKIIAFMVENKTCLSEKIKEDWSDRSDFISMMDNRFGDWLCRFLDDEVDARYISVMLGYMLYHDDEEVQWHLASTTMEMVYIGEFVIKTK